MTRTLAQAAAAGALVALAEYSLTLHGIDATVLAHVDWLVRLVVHWALASIPFVAAFAWLDARDADRPAPWRHYAFVTTALVAVVTPVLSLAAPWLLGAGEDRLLGATPPYADTLRFLAWQLAFWSAFGAILHRLDATALRSTRALLAAELGRNERAGRLVRSRRRAACARAVPEFLLSALRRIETIYGRDAGAADRAIGALVAYLRLALAHVREDATTLEAEARLVEAWLRAAGDECAGAIDAPAQASRITIEQGVVVPALYRLRSALGGGQALAVDVSLDTGRAVFAMRVAAGAATSPDLASVERDLASHADALDVDADRAQDGCWTLRVALPARA